MSMTKPPITIKALYICHECQTKSDAAVSVCQTVLDACARGTALCQLYRADGLHKNVMKYNYYCSYITITTTVCKDLVQLSMVKIFCLGAKKVETAMAVLLPQQHILPPPALLL
jgi:hypothetical protein